MGKKFLIRKQSGIDTVKITLDLDELLASGVYRTEDSHGWAVTAVVKE